MENFSPVSASIGGALIGAAAVMLMALNGRIAGISGIVSGGMFSNTNDRGWRLSFVAGLLAAPFIVWAFVGRPPFELSTGPFLLVLGGLAVGFGTRLGSGCTSGHGVCGLSRLSVRSVAAVVVFMSAGVFTASILRHFFWS